jgi:hypothetical protein
MTELAIHTTDVLQTYLQAWNSPDPAEREALLERTVSNDVVFVDPMAQLAGRAALLAHIADVRSKFGDVVFGPGGEPDEHNGYVRQAWLARSGGEVLLRGIDFDEVGADGRLTKIVGFFDRT